MEKEIEKLKVPKPCPFVPTRFNKNKDGFYCKSCTITIVDYRGKSISEIKSSYTQNSCGIFTSDQIQQQPKMKLTRQILFNCLAFLSIIGFSVKPLPAQNNFVHSDTSSVNVKTDNQDSTIVKKVKDKKFVSKNKKNFWTRRKYRKVIGCWEF